MQQPESFHLGLADVWERIVDLPVEVRGAVYLKALTLLHEEFERESFNPLLWEPLLEKAGSRPSETP